MQVWEGMRERTGGEGMVRGTGEVGIVVRGGAADVLLF